MALALESPLTLGERRKRLSRDEMRPAHGERPLLLVGERLVQSLGHQEPEHRVAEKLQALVVVRIRAALPHGRRGERKRKQRRVAEFVADLLLKFGHAVHPIELPDHPSLRFSTSHGS